VKKLNILYLISELLTLILISVLTTTAVIVLSVLVLIEYIIERFRRGFRSIIT
jgi:hypothetical protein